MHQAREPGEEDSPARRTATAEHVDLLVAAGCCLDRCRAVVHAGPDQRRTAGSVEPPERDADRDQDRSRRQLGVVVQRHASNEGIATQTGRAPGHDQVDAEPLGLLDRAPGEVASVEPGRKARVVLDHGAVAGLATRHVQLDDHGAQPFGRPVDRSGQPSWAAADHDQVVQCLIGLLSADPTARRGSAHPGRSGRNDPAGARSAATSSRVPTRPGSCSCPSRGPPRRPDRTSGTGRRCGPGTVFNSWTRGDHRGPTRRISCSKNVG